MGANDKNICTTLEKIELQPGPTKEEKDMLAREGKRIRMDHVLWLDADTSSGGYCGFSLSAIPLEKGLKNSREENNSRIYIYQNPRRLDMAGILIM